MINWVLQVTFINGILSSGLYPVMYQADFLVSLINRLIDNGSRPSGHLYQVFSVIKLWTQRTKHLVNSAGDWSPFSRSSHVVDTLLRLFSNNLDLPIKGASDLTLESMANLLDVVAASDTEDNYKELLTELMTANRKVSWFMKSKYPLLVILVPRIGFEKVNSSTKIFC